MRLDELGAFLRGARTALGLTQAQAGDLAGLSRATVSRIECSYYAVRISKHTALGDALGVPFRFTLVKR